VTPICSSCLSCLSEQPETACPLRVCLPNLADSFYREHAVDSFIGGPAAAARTDGPAFGVLWLKQHVLLPLHCLLVHRLAVALHVHGRLPVLSLHTEPRRQRLFGEDSEASEREGGRERERACAARAVRSQRGYRRTWNSGRVPPNTRYEPPSTHPTHVKAHSSALGASQLAVAVDEVCASAPRRVIDAAPPVRRRQ
jgi:hypothetical protein